MWTYHLGFSLMRTTACRTCDVMIRKLAHEILPRQLSCLWRLRDHGYRVTGEISMGAMLISMSWDMGLSEMAK